MQFKTNIRPVLIILMIGATCLTACTTFKTFRRYQSAAPAKVKDNLAAIDLFMTKVDSPAKKDEGQNLWKLADHGQAELIKTLDKRSPTNEKFIKSLNNTYLKKSDDGDPLDLSGKDLTMVFTITKQRDYEHLGDENSTFSPADRIEYLHYDLTFADTSIPLRFKRWNRYTTEYGSLDIGDVSFSRSLSATAGIGDSSFFLSPNVSVTGTASDSESQHIKYRFLKLNGQIRNDNTQLYVEEEGQREIDLTGNVIANVTCSFRKNPVPIFTAGSLQDDDNKYNQPEKVSITPRTALVPDVNINTERIDARLTMVYIYRHVTNFRGQRSFYEWDDKVQYYKGTDTKTVTLFRKEDILPKIAYIGKLGQDKNVQQPYRFVLKVRQNGLPEVLRFKSVDDANDFIDWLENFPAGPADLDKPIVIGGFTILRTENGTEAPLTKKYIDDNKTLFLAVSEYYQ